MADIEKTVEGIEAIREFFGFGLPSQNKVFEAYCEPTERMELNDSN